MCFGVNGTHQDAWGVINGPHTRLEVADEKLGERVKVFNFAHRLAEIDFVFFNEPTQQHSMRKTWQAQPGGRPHEAGAAILGYDTQQRNNKGIIHVVTRLVNGSQTS